MTTSPERPDISFLLAHPAHLIALGFGLGLSRRAPGTAGTLLGYPLFLLLRELPGAAFWLGLGAVFAVGVWCCERTGRALGVADPGAIVWDEVVAFALVLAFVPATWVWWLAAFGLFRLFDIWKPWPIRWLERSVKGGLGVMADDLVAGLYAVLVLQVAMWGMVAAPGGG